MYLKQWLTKGLIALPTLFFMSCSSRAVDLPRVQDAYISEVTKCLAKNHTLINKREVVSFLQGTGQADVQTLEFLSNKKLEGFDISASSYGVELGVGFDLEGENIKTFLIKRQRSNGRWFYKIDKGRLLVPSKISHCEKMRTQWASIDNKLNYTFAKQLE